MATGIHVFLEGIAIGVIFGSGEESSNIVLVIAIISHVIPEKVGDTSMLLYCDFTVKKAALCNFIVNLLSLVGS